MQPLVRLIGRNIGPYWGYVALVVLCQTIATAMALYLPTLNARLIDEGVVQGDLDYIWRTGGLMLIFGLVQSLAQIIAVYLGARTAMSLGRQIRAAMFRRTLEFSTQEINHFGAPTLLTRSTNDVQQVQQFVYMSLVLVVGAPITMVGGAVMA
ncbi:MAG: multidrug ABC transporter ATP-binding protein, partial [Arachnia propionica]